MGGFCSACKKEEEINMEESGWTKAVNEQNKGACQFLYLDDPLVFDKPVNRDQQKAIHISVIKNNIDFLEWIVKLPGANINITDRDGNTALHIASQLGYGDIVQILLQNNADININNKKGQKPIDIAHKNIKSLLNPRSVKKLLNEKDAQIQRAETEKILIGGISVDSPRFQKNEKDDLFSISRARQGTAFAKLTTKFGTEVGIEIDDIVGFLNKLGKVEEKNKLWIKFVGNDKQLINKENDLRKIVYGLTFAALRRKNAKANRPPPESIKELIAALKVKLQTSRFGPNFELSQDKFNNEFHNILAEIAQDMKANN